MNRKRVVVGLMLLAGMLAGMLPVSRTSARSATNPLILNMGADFGRLAMAINERTGRLFIASQTTVSVYDSHNAIHLRDLNTVPVMTVVCKTSVCPNVPPTRGVVVQKIPERAVVDEATNRLFITDSDYGHVSVLNATGGAFLRNVRVGRLPGALAVDQRVGHVFVANTGDDSVSMLNAHNGRVLRTIAVGDSPSSVAADVTTGRVFVANALDNTVTVLESSTGRVLGTIAVGRYPQAISVDGRLRRAFVVNRDGNSVSVLDAGTGKLLRTAAVGGSPLAVVADEATGRVFVMNYATCTVSMLDGVSGRIVRTIALNGPPRAATVDRRTGQVLVVLALAYRNGQSSADGAVSVLDGRTGRLVRTLSVGHVPDAAAIDDRTNRAFVLNQGCIGVASFDSFAMRACQGINPFRTYSIVDVFRQWLGDHADGTSQDSTVNVIQVAQS